MKTNKLFTILLMGLLFLSFAAAQETDYAEVNTVKNIKVVCLNDGYCSNASYCNINVEDPNGALVLENQNLTYQSSFHNYSINLSTIGTYEVSGFCIDGTDSQEIDFQIKVNYEGKAIPEGFDGRFVVLLFFILIVGLLVFLQYNINFDQWYKSIIRKNDKKNFFKTFMGGFGYFFMANPFSLFYMIGLFIVLLISDITRIYVIESAYYVMRVFVMIYIFGLLFIVLELFGDLHRFFSKMMEDVKKMSWGLDHD